MSDRQDKKRERREDEERRQEERERRSDELRESWRRNHPTEEEVERDWPKRGRRDQAGNGVGSVLCYTPKPSPTL